jgi:hypothetical protein
MIRRPFVVRQTTWRTSCEFWLTTFLSGVVMAPMTRSQARNAA